MNTVIVNPFDANGFDLATLTAAINLIPNQYGRLNQMNLFPPEGVSTRTILVEEDQGVLNLLPTRHVGEQPTQSKNGKRKMRSFVIPHIPLEDTIMPDEWEGVRTFGGGAASQALADIINRRLTAMRNKHAITLEWLRMGALKGIILDADGSVLYNLYNEFGITQAVQDCALDVSTTDVLGICMDVVGHIEDHLMGEVMTGVHCLCSPEFFKALITHPNVEKYYLNHAAAASISGGDPRRGFTFGGITFEEYRGQATDGNGVVRRFIAANEAHAFPVGTTSTFATLFGPGTFVEAANTIGQELYAKQETRRFGIGVDLHVQSNPLPICYRPGVLVKLTV